MGIWETTPVILRKFRVYSGKFRFNSRKLRVYSQKFALIRESFEYSYAKNMMIFPYENERNGLS